MDAGREQSLEGEWHPCSRPAGCCGPGTRCCGGRLAPGWRSFKPRVMMPAHLKACATQSRPAASALQCVTHASPPRAIGVSHAACGPRRRFQPPAAWLWLPPPVPPLCPALRLARGSCWDRAARFVVGLPKRSMAHRVPTRLSPPRRPLLLARLLQTPRSRCWPAMTTALSCSPSSKRGRPGRRPAGSAAASPRPCRQPARHTGNALASSPHTTFLLARFTSHLHPGLPP